MFKSLIIAGSMATVLLLSSLEHLHKPSVQGDNNTIRGEAPSVAADGQNLYLSFARGDSIFYTFSVDKGRNFATPIPVAVLGGLGSSGGRGPQIACSNGRLLIAAPDSTGNFYTYTSRDGKFWKKGGRINDLPRKAPEGFLSIAAGEKGLLFATWLDLRLGKKNNLYGARSLDGGKTWLKNQLVYQSPDGGICECCKPSVIMKGRNVSVLFRNNLKGNRDLYLIRSADGGLTFGKAQKLGEGNWKLKGCPMDGGGLAMLPDNTIQTAWRREGNIYTCAPGKPEILLAKGKQCAITSGQRGLYTCFINEGKVYCLKPDGQTVELGSGGSYPKMLAVDGVTIFCTWEMDHTIYMVVL